MSRRSSTEHIDWDQQPFGTMTDQALADRLGVSWSVVQSQRARRGIAPFHKRPSIDWTQQPLGKLTDGDLAEQLGVSLSMVRNARERLGIPFFSRRADIDWDVQPLGQRTDEVLAAELGVHRSVVRLERLARGIKKSWGNDESSRTVSFQIKLSPDEFFLWNERAREEGVDLSTYVCGVMAGRVAPPGS